MNMYKSFGHPFIFLLLLVQFSCGNATSESGTEENHETMGGNEALKKEVIAIHDEVMPKMGALKAHQKRLTEEISELKSLAPSPNEQEIVDRQDIIMKLDQAYEGMFVWMRQFKPHELDDMDEAEGKAYLLEQKSKVEKVNEDIKSALRKAEEVSL